LDGGLLRENVLLTAVKTLKNWEAEGRIELFEADRAKESPSSQTFGWPGAPPPPRAPSRFRGPKKSSPGSLSFQEMSNVLFPGRDPHRLKMNEVNDVAHLVRHHSLGHTFFVTTNVESFMAKGKREYLKAKFQIVVLTPEETVLALEKLEGFARKSSKGRAPHE
jgi:hypothetical protein